MAPFRQAGPSQRCRPAVSRLAEPVEGEHLGHALWQVGATLGETVTLLAQRSSSSALCHPIGIPRSASACSGE